MNLLLTTIDSAVNFFKPRNMLGRIRGCDAPVMALSVLLIITLAASAAFGQTTTTTTLPLPDDCVVDMQGADDEPGQKDLNQFCEAAGDSDFELHASWNFDDLQWSGSNTGDSCGLFDTNGNGFADFALCVTVVGGPPAAMKVGSPKLYMCGDTRPDRCTNAVEDTNGFASMCKVNDPDQDADPFANDASHVGSNSCKGTDCKSEDTFILCWIDTDDLPGDPASCVANECTNVPGQFCFTDRDCIPLTDVCSYPSEQPNSDPSDCIITGTAQDPCKNVDCSHLDDDCNMGVCVTATGTCTAQPLAAGTACGDDGNTICDNPDTCDGAGVCQPNYESVSVECRADAGECDVAELCDGAGNCPADGFEAAGTACGDGSDGICDNPDTCDANGTCQDNNEPISVECRADAGACDLPEYCDGDGACPADGFEAAGTACGDPSDSACDNPDTCDGSGMCQANLESAATVCRAAAGECDVAELCDGAGSCPADGFKASGTACGSGSDSVCDNPDTCDASGSCQANNESTSVECRADAGECDVAEFCDGNGACPADGFEPSGTACGDRSDGICDDPDTCDASGSCQSNHEPTSVECRADAGECDVPEFCDGDGACPEDGFEPAGTECGDDADTVCDNPDTCNGSGSCQTNYESSATVCRADAGQCDVAELCDGVGSCPADGFEPDGTTCGDGEECTGPDTCIEGVCQGDPIQPKLTVIKEVINDQVGVLEADDFDLMLDDGTTQTMFRVENDAIDPTIGSAVFDMEPGKSYTVTEILGALDAYYSPSYSGSCSGAMSCTAPNQTCTVTNDDIRRNQTSIAFRYLTIAMPEDDDSRMHLVGKFAITDESKGGDQPDGFIVLLDDYALDWEYRTEGDTEWRAHSWAGQHTGSLLMDGEWYDYGCDYGVVSIDGVVGEPAGYQSGDPVAFDERITMSYECWFDKALPEDGKVRGIATTGIFAKPWQTFLIRSTFSLDPNADPMTQGPTCEDPNDDDKLTASDALYLLRYALGLYSVGGVIESCAIGVCDQDCDGKVTASDALVALVRATNPYACSELGYCGYGQECCVQ